MDFSAWRDIFPVFRTHRYLNTASLGPLADPVRDAVAAFLGDWEARGARAWYERWLDALNATREAFARLVGATPAEVALAPNVSSALSAVASALRYGERSRVVTSELDFPTIPYQWVVREDVEVALLPSPDTITVPPEAYRDALDDRTALLATSHVLFATGFLQDVRRLARDAHDVGALCLVDGYHATGQLPVDVHDLGVDVYISGALKWLLGGPGLAFVYVRRERMEDLVPRTAGWFGNVHQFDFDPRRFAFRDDARRFELGTPAVAAACAAKAGIDLIEEVGPGRIRERTLSLAEDLIEHAEDAGLAVRAPPEGSRTGIVMIEDPHPEEAVQRLLDAKVIVDARGPRVRVSPFFYNTAEDNVRVVDVLAGRA